MTKSSAVASEKIPSDSLANMTDSLSTLDVKSGPEVPPWVKDIIDAQNDTESDTGASGEEGPGSEGSASRDSVASEVSSGQLALVRQQRRETIRSLMSSI